MPLVLRVGDRSVALSEGSPCVVGSGDDADVRVGHASVAPQHARLELRGTRLQVTDLGTVNGTWTDQARIDSVELKLGTEFKVGDIELRFEQAVADGALVPAPDATGPVPLAERWREPGFDELMADQLRRAPWVAISIVAHVLLLLILQALFASPPEATKARVTLTIGQADPDVELVEDLAEETEIVIEQPEHELVLQEVDTQRDFDEPVQASEVFDPGEFETTLLGEGMLEKVKSSSGSEILDAIGRGGDAEQFRSKISSLRKSGLDIVFVFDSTQSMHDVLDETKHNIALMLDVLQALVRGARVGIVTYRDHGPREDYLTREIPLDDDYYRAINFMQTVYAGGGHDYPEAIYDAMLAASRMKWRRGSQHVIVLIGDAPAHPNTNRKLRSLIRRFVGDKRSVVHAIMTPRDSHGVDPECKENFGMIAEAGNGSCIPLGDRDRILRDVMSLAIGQSYARNIDKIYDAVNEHRTRISPSARALVDRQDVDAITDRVARRRVDHDLVHALSKARSAQVAHGLLDMLADPSTSQRQRHTLAFVLSQMLALGNPPVDPETEKPPTRDQVKMLSRRIDERLR